MLSGTQGYAPQFKKVKIELTICPNLVIFKKGKKDQIHSTRIIAEKQNHLTKNGVSHDFIFAMANTYTQLYVQFVFSVKGRSNLIKEPFREELEKVMCGIVTNLKCKPYAIYCNPDHTHILVGMHPALSCSKLMEQVKSGSSNWLNEKNYISGKFSWQDGYGGFTYSRSHIDKVVKYILNQPEHHKKQSFRDEYLLLLEKFEIEFDAKYLFEWYD